MSTFYRSFVAMRSISFVCAWYIAVFYVLRLLRGTVPDCGNDDFAEELSSSEG